MLNICAPLFVTVVSLLIEGGSREKSNMVYARIYPETNANFVKFSVHVTYDRGLVHL